MLEYFARPLAVPPKERSFSFKLSRNAQRRFVIHFIRFVYSHIISVITLCVVVVVVSPPRRVVSPPINTSAEVEIVFRRTAFYLVTKVRSIHYRWEAVTCEGALPLAPHPSLGVCVVRRDRKHIRTHTHTHVTNTESGSRAEEERAPTHSHIYNYTRASERNRKGEEKWQSADDVFPNSSGSLLSENNNNIVFYINKKRIKNCTLFA